jgi:hypothetical protein
MTQIFSEGTDVPYQKHICTSNNKCQLDVGNAYASDWQHIISLGPRTSHLSRALNI